MAAALHVIANQLCTIIFRPCYIPESLDVSEAIREIFKQQYMNNPKKERLTRALLISTFEPQKIDGAIKRAATSASENVLKLLSSIGGNEDFRKDIERFFFDAANVWKEAQYSTKMVEASMEDDDEWIWGELEEFTAAAAGTDPNMLTLFPRVYVTEDEHIVSSGFVLWGDQPIVLAAEQEYRDSIAARRPIGGSVRRERRSSTVPDRRNGVTPSSPTSLKNENRAPFLEAQRSQIQESQIQNGTGGKG